MLGHQIVDTIGRQKWLDSAGQVLQQAITSALKATGPAETRVANFLHGTWGGHPFHPMLTDVPLGSWTAALTLDTLDMIDGDDTYAPGADAAIALGLAGAVAAIVTGLTDWQHTQGKPRRIGVVHGLLNLTASGLYAASLLVRRRGDRDTGRALALAGYAIGGAAAFLGGDLVYGQRVGVTHAPDVSLAGHFAPVLAEADLPEGEMRRVEVEGVGVMLARHGGHVYALAEHCAHMGGPLSEGQLEDGSVRCPWHGSRFALEDGRVIEGPATFPQPCFKARVRDGQIEVQAARTVHQPAIA